ncbi:hypothetical protein MKW98_002709 [Papaver atlanticum]|uniref:Uncharacterized protein n=1 Tax=Papaver atlanticum TaxID=357466 RepID=A0AAD4XAQ2_9MAGN|nr:hypothetical protein MKW98_002709 [Papaver atlanticum]
MPLQLVTEEETIEIRFAGPSNSSETIVKKLLKQIQLIGFMETNTGKIDGRQLFRIDEHNACGVNLSSLWMLKNRRSRRQRS